MLIEARKNILVTGASGFLGAHIVYKLLEKGFAVHALVRKSSDLSRLGPLKDSALILHRIKGLEKEEIIPIFQAVSPYAVIHTAASGVFQNEQEETKLIETNIWGTLNLIQAAAGSLVKRFIHTGSCFELGGSQDPISEKTPPSPRNFYGVTKAASTLLALQQGEALKVPTLVLRLFGLYGPLESEARFIPTIIKACLTNQKVQLTSGKQIRDYTYIEDVANLYCQLVSSDFFPQNEIFHIGSSNACSIYSLGTLVEKMTKKTGILCWGALDSRKNEADALISDPSKAKKLLGWEAKTSLEEGIERLLYSKNYK